MFPLPGGGTIPFTAQSSGTGDDAEDVFKTVYEGLVANLAALERKQGAAVQVLAVSHALVQTDKGYTCCMVVAGVIVKMPPLPLDMPRLPGKLR